MNPMSWIGNVMWWLCWLLGNGMTLIGMVGLLAFIAYGFGKAIEKITQEE